MHHHRPVVWHLNLTYSLARALIVYWTCIFPRARCELRAWEAKARRIPDPILRDHALAKLRDEHLSAEGAAAFAILVRPRQRASVIRLCVAFEVMYDYVDGIGERDVPDVLNNNRRLHRALVDAFACGDESNYYTHNRSGADGGYLPLLVATCRREFERLPARALVVDGLVRSAVRASEAQSLNHAGLRSGHRELAAWATHEAARDGRLQWWEHAAAAGSPLGIFALIAAAADDRMHTQESSAIEEAYFPWIAALHWLLESLVDRGEDAHTGNHSYVSRYPSQADATRRLAVIARHAAADARRLPHAGRHTALLIGMVSLNLSHKGAASPTARDAGNAVRNEFGWLVTPVLVGLRVRQLHLRHGMTRLSGAV